MSQLLSSAAMMLEMSANTALLRELMCGQFMFIEDMRISFLQSSYTWLGDRKGIRPVKKPWCWFIDGDNLTGALHDL